MKALGAIAKKHIHGILKASRDDQVRPPIVIDVCKGFQLLPAVAA
jgi:hypothetical protein